MTKNDKKTCLECGSELYGRIDKKYCSDQCRTQHYNRTHNENKNLYREINAILKKNHMVLQKLNPSGKTKISEIKLLENGFKLNYFTNLYTTKKGITYYFCYDQGLIKTDNGSYALFKKVDFD